MWDKIKALMLPGRGDDRYVPVADGLRAMSVLIVAWFHIWQQSWLAPVFTVGPVTLNLYATVRAGYIMVDMLLLLSGFLLFLPYARARVSGGPLPDTREYFIKRALRILPSYWLCLFVMLFVFDLPNHQYGNLRHFLLDFVGHLTFTHNLTYEGYIGTRLNGVLWTLAVEGQFYLIAPLLGRAFVKKPLLTYAGMVSTAFMYRFVYVAGMQDTSLYFNRLPAMLDVYANGTLFAWLYVTLKKRLKPTWFTGGFFLILCVAALAAMGVLSELQARRFDYEDIRMGQMLYRFPLSLAGGVFLAAGSQAPAWFQWLFGNRLARFLAGISYNLYIWHQHFALRLRAWHIPPYEDEMPQRAGEQPWQTAYTLLCFAGAIAIAALLTYLWERPLNRLGAKRLLGGKRRASN